MFDMRMFTAVFLAGLAGGAIASALINRFFPPVASPVIVGVDLEAILREDMARAARVWGKEEIPAKSAEWSRRLDAVLQDIARRHGVVILPSQAIAAGAPDATAQVRALLNDAKGEAP